MPTATFSAIIDASQEEVWDLLLDKIESPQKYIHNVVSAEIVERLPDSLLRRMRVAETEIMERITMDATTKEVRFELVGHPSFTGGVTNRLSSLPLAGKVRLTFTLEWNPALTSGETAASQEVLAEDIRAAVLHIKKLAET